MKKWISYERRYSNWLWHTDWKPIEGYGWFTALLDDAPRFTVGRGLIPEDTSEHSVEVLKETIDKYGKPAAVKRTGGLISAVETGERLKGLPPLPVRSTNPVLSSVFGFIAPPPSSLLP